MEQSRILGERAIYYAERTPTLLDLQTRALGAAVADMPETRSVLANANRVGESAASLAETAAMLPETFRKEREATIEQLLNAMEQQQGVMRELVLEVRQSLEAVPKASDSIRGVLDGIDALMRRPKVGEPPPPGSVPGRPFDITEYTQAAATIGEAAKQLQTLVTMLEHDAPAATQIGDAMRGHAERVVDHLYKRVIEAFGVLFVAVLMIVLASRLLGAHLAQRAARRTSAGNKVR
jgi:cytochrome c556